MSTAIRNALSARAQGRCECGCLRPLGDFGELDHFFGRSKVEEQEFNCWILHRDCHHAKTNSKPTAAHWFAKFIAHCNRWMETPGYAKAAAEAQKNWDWRAAKLRTPGAV